MGIHKPTVQLRISSVAKVCAKLLRAKLQYICKQNPPHKSGNTSNKLEHSGRVAQSCNTTGLPFIPDLEWNYAACRRWQCQASSRQTVPSNSTSTREDLEHRAQGRCSTVQKHRNFQHDHRSRPGGERTRGSGVAIREGISTSIQLQRISVECRSAKVTQIIDRLVIWPQGGLQLDDTNPIFCVLQGGQSGLYSSSNFQRPSCDIWKGILIVEPVQVCKLPGDWQIGSSRSTLNKRHVDDPSTWSVDRAVYHQRCFHTQKEKTESHPALHSARNASSWHCLFTCRLLQQMLRPILTSIEARPKRMDFLLNIAGHSADRCWCRWRPHSHAASHFPLPVSERSIYKGEYLCWDASPVQGGVWEEIAVLLRRGRAPDSTFRFRREMWHPAIQSELTQEYR